MSNITQHQKHQKHQLHTNTSCMDLAIKKRIKTKFYYTQYGPIKNGGIKNQHSDFEKNKEPVVKILGLKNRFIF